MSILKRRIITAFFILLFLVLAPMIIFYANGNILGSGWNILATGGIYVNSMEPGAELFLDGQPKGNAGFFARDYFLKNLMPGSYTILVKKDGYNDWTNKIKVYANRVTESNVFMLPAEINTAEIRPYLEIEKTTGTTTKKISQINPNYAIVNNLFSSSSLAEKFISILSTSTGKTTKYAPGTKENPIKSRHLSIWQEGRNVFIGWTGSLDSSPKFFCEESQNDLKCQNQLKIYSFESDVSQLDFFPGESEVVVVSVESDIYAVEAGSNPDKKPQILYRGKKPDFRVADNAIYVKDGNFLGQVEI